MKNRSGFVSNSSSSSFIVVAPTAIVEEVQKEMTVFAKAYVNHVKTKETRFMGKDITIFSGMLGNADSWECFDVDEFPGTDEQKEEPWEIWTEFIDKLKELGGEDNFLYEESEEC
jgi:hypothetical protein